MYHLIIYQDSKEIFHPVLSMSIQNLHLRENEYMYQTCMRTLLCLIILFADNVLNTEQMFWWLGNLICSHLFHVSVSEFTEHPER